MLRLLPLAGRLAAGLLLALLAAAPALAVEPDDAASSEVRAPLDAEPDGELATVLARADAAMEAARLPELVSLLGPVMDTLRERFGPAHPITLRQRRHLAMGWAATGRWERAVEELLAVEAAWLEHGDRFAVDLALARMFLGMILADHDRFEEALPYLQQASDVLRDTDADGQVDAVLAERNLAVTWAQLGQPDTGREIFAARQERLRERFGPTHAATLDNLAWWGEFEVLHGDTEAAIELLTEGLATSVATHGEGSYLTVDLRLKLAVAYTDLRQFSDAEAVLRPAVAELEPDDVHPGIILKVHRTLAEARLRTGDPDWMHSLERALAVAREHFGPDSEAIPPLHHLRVRDELRRQEPDYALARRLMEDAIRILRGTRGPDHRRTQESELLRIQLEIEAGNLSVAAREVEEMSARNALEDVVAISLQQRLADLHAARGELEEALEVRRSIARKVDLLPDDTVGIFDLVNDLYTAWLLLRMGRVEEARPVIESTFDALNAELLTNLARNGERALIHLLQQWDVASHLLLSIRQEASFDAENWRKMLEWRGFGPRLLAHRAQRVRAEPELATLHDRRARLRTEASDQVREGASGPELEALRTEIEQLERELLQRMGTPPTPEALAPTIPELCAALPRGARLVHVVRWLELGHGNDDITGAYDAFVLHSRTCEVHRVHLGPAKAIDAELSRWRRAITAQGTDPSLAARFGEELSALLLPPLVPHLDGADRVIFVPDGKLSLVSWAGLPHPDGGYLVEHAELTVLQDVAELLHAAPARRGPDRSLLVGAVDYGEGPPAAPEPATEPEDDTSGDALADAFDPDDRSSCVGQRFAPLPGTEAELDAIAPLVPGTPSRLDGTEATPAAVRRAMGQASHIHLATHGFFTDERCLDGEEDPLRAGSPLARSGLALSGANDGEGPDGDGLLTAEELLDLDLTGAELVVLSACDTGRGEIATGQGVLGLRWALSLAGAHSQIFSLWPIPDAETSTLMRDVYEALGPGRPCRRCSPAAALQHAQRRALERQRAAGTVDVRTWAAFQASGAPRR